MITEYNRPSTLESALELLARKTPVTVPLAGGTLLNRKTDADFAVVDIQALPLKTIQLDGNTLRLGAGVNLQELIDHPDVPAILKEACRKETSYQPSANEHSWGMHRWRRREIHSAFIIISLECPTRNPTGNRENHNQ